VPQLFQLATDRHAGLGAKNRGDFTLRPGKAWGQPLE